ncbi:hypothetical protein F383_22613 [Gossypium arboreum]|uniref:Uncharacterized protein n=1 Tax=Gossypium arboreum TaxID=29729 RepID=A0A0B0MFP6_GOSAR|nr:hypothetical protein F383_22613 [Gossypium arboreum]
MCNSPFLDQIGTVISGPQIQATRPSTRAWSILT